MVLFGSNWVGMHSKANNISNNPFAGIKGPLRRGGRREKERWRWRHANS